jgi:hypothetical protein
MDLFSRAKGYLARSLSDDTAFDSINCGEILDDRMLSEKYVMAAPESYDLFLEILPKLRSPFSVKNEVPLPFIKKDPTIYALALDLCFQEDIAHDTLGGVFPLSRFLEGSLFQDARSYGVYELIDNPAVMASTHATEKLIMDIERTMPDESNFAVVITSQPTDSALENESYFIFNGSERFYNYPSAEQTVSMNGKGVAQSLLEMDNWNQQKELLQNLDASAVVWVNILQQKTQEGDAFYVHETRIVDHKGNENILKHMGFSVDRTHMFWPSILLLSGMYLLVVSFFLWVFFNRKNKQEEKEQFLYWVIGKPLYFIVACLTLPLTYIFHPTLKSNPISTWFRFWYTKADAKTIWSIINLGNIQKQSSSIYIVSLLCVAPFVGFFAYLFLASFLVPLQPSLGNLWFVSAWWPIFTFCAIFTTPLIVYWPLKNRLSKLTSDEFDSFFPVFSFLALFGASLHLTSDLFFIYKGWALFWFILSVFYLISTISFFIHNTQKYSLVVSVIVLLMFGFLYLSAVHFSTMLIFTFVVLTMTSPILWILQEKNSKRWTEDIWADQEIRLWTDILDHTYKKIQKIGLEHPEVHLHHEKGVPSRLFFYKLKLKISSKEESEKGNVHKIISLEESDMDLYEFQKKAFDIPKNIGQIAESFQDEDPLATQKKHFQNNLDTRLRSFQDNQTTYYLYIADFQLIHKNIKECLYAYISEMNQIGGKPPLFIIGAQPFTNNAQNLSGDRIIPPLPWSFIKEISESYISPEIMQWIEKEAKSDKNIDIIPNVY